MTALGKTKLGRTDGCTRPRKLPNHRDHSRFFTKFVPIFSHNFLDHQGRYWICIWLIQSPWINGMKIHLQRRLQESSHIYTFNPNRWPHILIQDQSPSLTLTLHDQLHRRRDKKGRRKRRLRHSTTLSFGSVSSPPVPSPPTPPCLSPSPTQCRLVSSPSLLCFPFACLSSCISSQGTDEPLHDQN